MDNNKKVIIIGAGPAGLSAAYYILKHSDIKPIILEASPYIGGISRTHVHNGNRIDLGGHRFFTKNNEVSEFWNEILTADKEIPAEEKDRENAKVFMKRHRISRIYFNNKFFDYPVTLSPKTFINMGFKNVINVGFGYIHSMIFKRKENSLEDFYINRFGKPLYEMFFEDYTEKLWGKHPRDIAPDWGSQRVKKLSLLGVIGNYISNVFNLKREKETTLIEEFLYPPKGPGQFYEELASRIEGLGGKILLKTPVTKINFDGMKIISVETTDYSGEKQLFECDELFSSMPIKDLFECFNKDVGQTAYNLAKELPYRDYITVGLLVNKLKINIQDEWIYIQEKKVKLARIQIFNNWSPYMVDSAGKTFIGLEYFCNENDNMWNADEKTFIEKAAEETEAIGLIDKSEIIDSVLLKQKKAYPAYWGTYKHFNIIKAYLENINNLYCIGRNGQHRYNNMDHSILTAFEAGKAMIENTDKRKIWKVNTEEEYHEGK